MSSTTEWARTFLAGLDCLNPRGLMVTFGNASGAVPPIAPLELITPRFALSDTAHLGRLPDQSGAIRRKAAQELFAMIKKRKIRVHIGQRFALKDAARAHEALESRETRRFNGIAALKSGRARAPRELLSAAAAIRWRENHS